MTAGRPTSCTPEITELAQSYLADYETVHKHIVPSVVGLCKVLNIARSTLYEWAENTNGEFPDIFDAIKDYQHFDLTNKGLKGETNSVITKLMLTKHGYSDKQHTEHSGHINDYSDLEGDDLDRKLKDMRQKLDDSERD